MQWTSKAFDNHEPIAPKYTAEGDDVSPGFSWEGVPRGTRSFAIVCDDPDAPSRKHPGPEPLVHWVLYNIPETASGLPEGVERALQPSAIPGARQGRNSWPSDNVGYRGPAPPHGSGPHRYRFRLYALDIVLDLNAGASKKQLLQAMQGHLLAQCELVGIFER